MNNKSIAIFESLDSTNNYAMQKIHAGMAAHGDAFLALRQTAGKGQHGKIWLAENGQSVLLSKIFSMNSPNSSLLPINLGRQFELSALVAVAVREWFAIYAGDNVFIKWPNDVYYNDRKAGGILIENVIGQWSMGDQSSANWKWAVAGIGININQTSFPENLANAISLKQITGKDYDVIELANKLNDSLENYWEKWLKGDWKTIYNLYNDNLYKRGKQARLRKGNIIMPCTIKSVSEKGKLLIDEDDSVEFTVGEVSWEHLSVGS